LAIVAIVVIVGAIIGLYVGGYFTGGTSPFGPPFDFTLRVNPDSGTVLQGKPLTATVSVSLSGGSGKEVALSASGGPTGATYAFSPQIGVPPYTSTLMMTIPESVPTAAYSLTVTATGGGVTRSSTFTLSVLSAKVTVSGKITTTGIGTSPTGIMFVSGDTGETFTAPAVGNSYSITLPNQQTYRVTVSWSGLLGVRGTFDAGTLKVNVGVGTTTMTQNFAG